MTPEGDTPDTIGETWEVIIQANAQQVITVHLNEKLAVKIHQVLEDRLDSDFSFKNR
ncbi:MAG: hypothetical protein K2W97_08900 [Chthoniobacterales bacterium]|nr:hypothetical protein [Chthoniobacterales bacterium]